jgi:hypothetical protein
MQRSNELSRVSLFLTRLSNVWEFLLEPLSKLGRASFIAISLKQAITVNGIGALKRQRMNYYNNW